MATAREEDTGGVELPPDRVRNVVLVGHAGSGKTTLLEQVLVATGAVPRAGRVEEGTTVSDHDEVEQRIGRSVSLSVASVVHDGVRLNLIDTPGHADFVGELRAGLRAADAALFVVSAVDGVDGATRVLWEECAGVGMPRAVVITHVDQPRGDVDAAVAICQRLFGEGVQPLYLPLLGDDDAPSGLLGLLSGTVRDYSQADPTGGAPAVREADPEHLDAVQDTRSALIEGIIQESEDDTLLDRYLSGEEVGFDTLVGDLETAVARGSFHPVLPFVGPTGLGVHELLEVVIRGFPSPLEHPLPAVTTPDGEPREALTCDPDGPLVAEVVKTTTDPYVGRVSVVRVFSGTLQPDVPLHVSGHFSRFSHRQDDEAWHPEHDVDERAGAVSRPLGAKLTPLSRARAGDIVAVARLTRAETGDTLSDPASPALMEPWAMPEPLLPVAVSARSSADEDKLGQQLSRLQAEDPTVRVEVNPDTHQMLLWAMGEAHLDVLLDRLRSRGGIDVTTEPVRVAMRETFAAAGAGHGRHVKQSGGHGQYAVCDIEVEPLPEGAGFEFVDKVVGGAVPRQFIGSVEKGIRAQMAKGVAAGYPVVDLRVTLVGGKAHSVDSSDAAFQTAGALALKEAAAAAGVAMLEPVDEVEVVVDDEYVGAVLSDLATRRGRVTGTDSVGAGGRSRVTAEVPAFELTRYAADLRSLAHGTGTFTRRYRRHAPAPKHVVERLTGAGA
jgi:elongation factor G